MKIFDKLKEKFKGANFSKLSVSTRGWKLPILALICFIFAISYSVLAQKKDVVRDPYAPPPRSHFVNSVSGIGIVEPQSELISLSVEIPGIVREIYTDVGHDIKKGEKIFALDQRDINSQIDILKATLVASEVEAENSSVLFNTVKKIKDIRAVSQDEFNTRKYALELANANVKKIDAQLEQAEVTKERLVVRSPIDGQILKLDVRLGEFAQTGVLVNPLVIVGNVDILHVRVEIDEENSFKIKPESRAIGFQRGETVNPIDLHFAYFEPHVLPKQNLPVVGQRVDTRVLQVIYSLPKGQENVFVGKQMDVFIEDLYTKTDLSQDNNLQKVRK